MSEVVEKLTTVMREFSPLDIKSSSFFLIRTFWRSATCETTVKLIGTW